MAGLQQLFGEDAAKFREEFDAYLKRTLGEKEYAYSRASSEAMASTIEDSDRSVGIVYATILEYRLEQCIRSRFRSSKAIDDRANFLLKPSGPLGPFSNKIDLGALLNLYGDSAWGTLSKVKDIRNKFAHEMDVGSFEHPSIKGKAESLTYIESFVEMKGEDMLIRIGRRASGMGPADALDKPRHRYIQTCLFFCNCLVSLTRGNEVPELHR